MVDLLSSSSGCIGTQRLLHSTCLVRSLTSQAILQGQLLEVRQLWIPATENLPSADLLYAFVRVKDADHRLSGWFPMDLVELKESAAPLRSVVGGPVCSSVYEEVTAGMARTQRAKKQLDYLEERLLRDCRTPTTVRFLAYLQEHIFAPWYYAPYGLLHPSYSPSVMVEVHSSWQQAECTSCEKVLPSPPLPSVPTSAAPSPPPTPTNTVLVKNPFIKDGFLCPFSLRIYEDADQMRYETLTYRCGQLAPPGTEIYCDVERGVSVYEVNGSRQTTYCRHLFLLGKSFLENKLAGHDVRNYLFYVVCLHHRHYPNYINDPRARYFAGYFTWEKQVVEYNLACIVTLPCFAGGASQPPVRHLGQLMISISYELAYRRGQCGGPEKPLSDLGAAAYQRYWQRQLLRWMAAKVSPPTSTGEDHPHEAPARASLSGEGDASRAANRRRPREVETGAVEVGNEGDEDGMLSGSRRVEGSATDEAPQYTTVAEVAAGVGLEEADVLRTMLSMGLLHRNAEDRSTRLVIPRQYVLRECQRMDQQQKDLHIAAFHPMKAAQAHDCFVQRSYTAYRVSGYLAHLILIAVCVCSACFIAVLLSASTFPSFSPPRSLLFV